VKVNGLSAIKFRGRKIDCRACELRPRCLRSDKSEYRQVNFVQEAGGPKPKTFSAMMRTKIDSIKGRLIYNRRLGTAEPPFANIKSALGLDRFTLRGQKKVGTQWRLYCIVHNILRFTDMGSFWMKKMDKREQDKAKKANMEALRGGKRTNLTS